MRIVRHPFLAWFAVVALLALVGGMVAVYVYRSSPITPDSSTEDHAAGTASAALTMEDDQRQYLWEIEHHGLVLSRHGFSRLADALSRGHGPALLALLAPDFRGQTLHQPREVRLDNDSVHIVRREDAGRPPTTLTREQFRDHLLDYRQLFCRPPKVQLSLMALSPSVRGDLEAPWRGTCLLRMWGEAAPGQPGEVVLYLQYEVPRPSEDAFRQDGWLRTCAVTQSQTARSPRFLLREAAAERGIDRRRFHDNWEHGMKATATGGVYLCDYNRDGYLDMLIVDLNCIALYKGLPGGKFVDVTQEVGLPWRLLNPTGANLVAAFADLDGDGWEDLILDKRIFRNEAGLRFQEVTHRSNLRLQGDVSGIAVADYDRDGRLDLYVARLGPSKASSWLDGKCGGKGGNLLFRNKGNWQFEEVAVAAGATGGDRSTFSAVWFDANNDGWPDLYVINEFGNGILLLNQGDGTFREQAIVAGPGDFGSMGVTAGDIDNDGNIDLYVANMYSKAGSRVIGNIAAGTYSDELMGTLRSFVTGSQLWRNRGVGGQGAAGGTQYSVLSTQYSVPGTRRAVASNEVAQPLPPTTRCPLPTFEPLGPRFQVAAVGWAYGPALVDLDNDGWLDLYATAGFVSQNRGEPDG
jgi:hypothetical protein